MGAAWLTIFFGSAEAMARGPVPWVPLSQVGTALVQGQLMAGLWVWAAPLGLLGAALVLRRGGVLGWAVLGLAVGQLVLASQDAITVLRLDLVLSGFKNLQFPRYAISFKPLWFALGGVAAGRLLALGPVRSVVSRPQGTTPMAWVRRGAGGLLLAPLVATLVPDAGRLLTRPVAAIDTLRGEDGAGEAALLKALRAESQALPPDRPLVVAVMRGGMGGGTYPVMTVADAGGRLVLDEHIPTVNFKHRVSRKPAAYERLGVTHVIHDKPVPEGEQALADSLTKVGDFGLFTLERFTPPRGGSRLIAELQGFGTVEVVAEEPERLELQVADVRPGTMLTIGRAPHLRWELYYEGELLETEDLRLGGTAGIGVELPGPGRVELVYVRSPLERRAMVISAAVLVMCLGGLLLRGPPLSSVPLTPRSRRISAAIVVGLGLVVIAGLVYRQGKKLEETWGEYAEDELAHRGYEDPSFIRDLVIDAAIEPDPTPPTICSGVRVNDARSGCSEEAHRPSDSFLYRDPYLYRCVRVSIPAKGTLTLHFPRLRDREVVAGSVIRHVRKGTGKKLFYGGRWVTKRMKNRLHDFVLDDNATKDGRPTLGLRNDGTKLEQVCVSAAIFERSDPR